MSTEPERTEPERIFIRCGSCDLIAEPSSMNYPIRSRTDRRIDWEVGPVEASCGLCGRTQTITAADVVGIDAEHVCPVRGCGAVTPCPAAAARVRCSACGVYGLGPGAAEDQARARIEMTERLHGLELHQTWLRAKRRAAGQPEFGDDEPSSP